MVASAVQCRTALKPDGLFLAAMFGGETLRFVCYRFQKWAAHVGFAYSSLFAMREARMSGMLSICLLSAEFHTFETFRDGLTQEDMIILSEILVHNNMFVLTKLGLLITA